jgi:small subunit ribosomal protein S2
LSGIKTMDTLPTVIFVIDSKKEAIAIREASRLGIMCAAVVDTNCDPDLVPLPIPGNDDAIRAVNLFCSTIADAVLEGLAQAEKIRAEQDARSGKLSPSADTEQTATEGAEATEVEAAVAVAADAAGESAAESDESDADDQSEAEGDE